MVLGPTLLLINTISHHVFAYCMYFSDTSMYFVVSSAEYNVYMLESDLQMLDFGANGTSSSRLSALSFNLADGRTCITGR